MDTMPDNIIAKIEAGYGQVINLCQSVPATFLVLPLLADGGSIKDTIAHLTAWQWRCAALLEAAHQTDAPLKAQPDVAALNREFDQERRQWSWDEVKEDFQRAHQAMLNVIQKLPPERLRDVIVQRAIAENTWEHYEKHLPEVQHHIDKFLVRGYWSEIQQI